jgi:hypothetical protein
MVKMLQEVQRVVNLRRIRGRPESTEETTVEEDIAAGSEITGEFEAILMVEYMVEEVM